MRPMIIVVLVLAAVLALLAGYTAYQSRQIEARFPPIGTFHEVDGVRLHAVHIPAGPQADLPPLVFLHGASGNLRDQLVAFGDPLKGRAEMLFVDRPGHGYSERGTASNSNPDGQADMVAGLMAKLGIDNAIIVAHSFGSAIAASFALQYPERTGGLLFLAPATHPWPGGVAWFYSVARAPVIGPLFSNVVALPVGSARVVSSAACVFAPNPMPSDYVELTGPQLVLRPKAFRANSTDVANLKDYVERISLRYPEIMAPAVVITGNRDEIVLPEIHSQGLARDLPNSELVEINNLGHKPDYVARDIAIAAIEKLAGGQADLQAMVRALEERIADDAEVCG
ncbi:alpha/beta hydrolase [Georhizobium profundi]|uniref:Alpha/beta hydrolase n=2 Tax=Georhizobium profundi TaxID=2341112 RepID=A0A3S9B8A2_9HYPH|nr:alpha/beta hydrolase [Georhizobium profundi]